MTSSAQVLDKTEVAKSTNSQTEPNPHRTRLNAYRHELTGQVCIFAAAEQEAFEKHRDSIREALEPVGALELELAQSIAEDRWRLTRARALEGGIFALSQNTSPDNEDAGQLQIDTVFAQARTWLADGQNLQLLALYEQRIYRAIEQNMTELRSLQAKRKAAHQQALEEAQLLAKLAYIKGEQYESSRDFPPETLAAGAGFSTADINRLLRKNLRLTEARFYAENQWDTKHHFPKPGFRIPNTP